MPRTNTIENTKTGTKEVITFEDGELETLESFCTEFAELSACSLFGANMPMYFGMRWSQQTSVVEYQSDPINKEAWRAAMSLLRLLTLSSSKEKKPFDFLRCLKIISRKIKDSDLRQHLKDMKARFHGEFAPMQFGRGVAKEPGKIEFDENGRPKGLDTMEVMYEKWIYAYELHRDPEKQEYFESAPLTPIVEMRNLIFLHICEKMIAMQALAQIIEAIGGRKELPNKGCAV